MSANLLSIARDALGADFSNRAGQFLGESPAATQSAMAMLPPVVLGGIAQKGATRDGAVELMYLIDDASLEPNALGNIAGLFGGGGAGLSGLLKAGTMRLVPALFGDKSGALVNALSAASGIRGSSAINLIAMVVSLMVTLLRKFIDDNGLDAHSLAALLGDQGPNLYGALDSRLTGALGYASPAAYFGRLGGEAAAMAKRVATRGADASASTAAAATTATACAGVTVGIAGHTDRTRTRLGHVERGEVVTQCIVCQGADARRSGCNTMERKSHPFQSPYRCRECGARFWVVSRKARMGAATGGVLVLTVLLFTVVSVLHRQSASSAIDAAASDNVQRSAIQGSMPQRPSLDELIARQNDGRAWREPFARSLPAFD